MTKQLHTLKIREIKKGADVYTYRTDHDDLLMLGELLVTNIACLVSNVINDLRASRDFTSNTMGVERKNDTIEIFYLRNFADDECDPELHIPYDKFMHLLELWKEALNHVPCDITITMDNEYNFSLQASK